MNTNIEFNPDWFSSPGDTIQDVLSEKGIHISELADSMDIDLPVLKKVISGDINICSNTAESLARCLGSSKAFWMKRDEQYKKALKIQSDRWMDKMPYQSMAKDGWVPKTRKAEEKLRYCLDFFKVDSVNTWYKEYEDILYSAAFRTSKSYDSILEPTVAWIQKGKTDVGCIQKSWSKEVLESEIQNIRNLTLELDPQIFLPDLKAIFEKAGVLFALTKCPSGCAASGATFFKGENPVLLMSARYLSEDHFWFTLFHEIGHLLMHSGDGELFIEGQCQDSPEEQEANDFAQSVIIPKEYLDEFKTLNMREWRNIPRFAKKIGISRGLLIGQMQFHKLIKQQNLNKFKVKYKWSQELNSLVLK